MDRQHEPENASIPYGVKGGLSVSYLALGGKNDLTLSIRPSLAPFFGTAAISRSY